MRLFSRETASLLATIRQLREELARSRYDYQQLVLLIGLKGYQVNLRPSVTIPERVSLKKVKE